MNRFADVLAFRRERLENTFLDPRDGFRPRTEVLEVRFDPLTGRTAHVAHLGAIRPVPLSWAEVDVPARRVHCPFCPERREAATPCFPPDLIPEGRLSRGEALVVPNIAPYDQVSAITILTHRHLVPMTDFTESQLVDALTVTLDFLRRVRPRLSSTAAALLCWNYMPPSGGGLVHPHVQSLVTHFPGNLYRAELDAAADYARRTGRSYWRDLVEAELQAGERYIGCTGRGHWLAAFAPVGTIGEILGVFPDVETVEAYDESLCRETARAFRRLFRFFETCGASSFNAALCFAPAGWSGWCAYWRVVPRTYLNNEEKPADANVFQVVLREPVSSVVPEDLCRAARPFFVQET